MDRLDGWLAGLPRVEGFRSVSDARHFGGSETGEADYAAQFVVDEAYEQGVARGLQAALADCDTSAPALEIGSGTGILSRPLIAATDFPRYFISDMSPEFLRLTRDSVPANGKPTEYVVLTGDDVARWPERTLSLVALRFVLHHVLDWEGFLRQAARLLKPGGMLLLEEPFADGYLLQVALAELVRGLPELEPSISPQARAELERFCDITFWYLTTGIDKQAAEDKHVFGVAQLLTACRAAGLEPTHYPNRGLEGGLQPRERDYFRSEFRHNLAGNFGFGEETLALFDRYLAPICERIAALDPDQCGPCVRAVVVARRPAPGLRSTGQEAARRSLDNVRRALPPDVRRRVPAPVRSRLRRLVD